MGINAIKQTILPKLIFLLHLKIDINQLAYVYYIAVFRDEAFTLGHYETEFHL